jgi:hypothetical protein
MSLNPKSRSNWNMPLFKSRPSNSRLKQSHNRSTLRCSQLIRIGPLPPLSWARRRLCRRMKDLKPQFKMCSFKRIIVESSQLLPLPAATTRMISGATRTMTEESAVVIELLRSTRSWWAPLESPKSPTTRLNVWSVRVPRQPKVGINPNLRLFKINASHRRQLIWPSTWISNTSLISPPVTLKLPNRLKPCSI